jgi:flagellar biosynthesis chaperone FliJ
MKRRMSERLRPIVDWKKTREDHAAQRLRAARTSHDAQQAVVDEQRAALARERARCDDIDLYLLSDLADQRTREHLRVAEDALAKAAAVVDEARGDHQVAAVEHRALLRLYERRQDESRAAAAKKEQRALDELAAR